MALKAAKTIVQSWDEVDDHLKEIALLDIQMESIEAELTRKVNELKADAKEEQQPLLARKERLEAEVEEFMNAHRESLGDAKSKQITFGTVGFRKTTGLVIRGVKKLMETLKHRGMNDCIRIKESLNRDALGQYSDDVLKSLGVKRKTEEKFWYKVDREKVQGD